MILGLDHIHVICGDVEKAVGYFEKVFDGRVISRDKKPGLFIVRMDVKGVPIALMGTKEGSEQLTPGKGYRGLDHFGLRVSDLEKTAEELKSKGAIFSISPNISATGAKYAFIEGPEGIRIELVQRD
jgi:lactoylglutathione lyase